MGPGGKAAWFAFATLLVVGVAAALISPGVAPFVVAGVLIALVPRAVRRFPATRNMAMPVTVLLLLAVVVIFAFAAEESAFTVPESIDVPGTYTAKLMHGTGPERFDAVEQLEVARKGIDEAAASPFFDQRGGPLPKDPEDRAELLADRLELGLAEDGWTQTGRSNLKLDFEKPGESVRVESKGLRAQTSYVLDPGVERVDLPGLGVDVRIELDDKSEVVFEAPKHTVGPTYPDAKRELRRRGRNRELTRVPVAGLDGDVEFEVRREFFRHDATAAAADVTVESSFRWILTFLLGAVGAVTDEVVKNWLKRRFGIGKKKEEDGEGT